MNVLTCQSGCGNQKIFGCASPF